MTTPGPAAALPYYHTFKNYDEVRKTFLPYLQKDGYFLLRNSMRGNQYCLSVVHNKEIKHMRIEERSGTFVLQDLPFPSLDKLVLHYKKNEIPNDEKIRHIRLLYPIHPTSARRGSDGEALNLSRSGGTRVPTRAFSVPNKRDNKNKNQAAGAARSSLPTSRPPPALPREVLTTQVEAPATRPPDYCYDYAKLTDHIEEVKKNVRLMDLEDAGKICQCGLLIEASKMPMGWTVHRSTEPDTAGRVFFVSPTQLSAWDLPPEIDALLTGDKRLFIEGLRQNASRF